MNLFKAQEVLRRQEVVVYTAPCLGETGRREPVERRLRGPNGVVIEDVAGVAGRAGVRQGDVIVAVNNVPIKSPEQLRKLVRSAIWNDVRASRTAPPARFDIAKDVR